MNEFEFGIACIAVAAILGYFVVQAANKGDAEPDSPKRRKRNAFIRAGFFAVALIVAAVLPHLHL